MESKSSKLSKKEIMIRIVCVVIAFILWLYRYNTENSERTVSIYGVHVKVLNPDVLNEKNLMYANTDKDITANIKVRTTDAGTPLANQFSIELDLKGKVLKAGRNLLEFTITSWPDFVSIPNTVGTLNVDLVEKAQVQKDITVIPIGEPAKDYLYLGTVIKGGTAVKAVGPKDIINSIDKIGFFVTLTDLEEDYNFESETLNAYDKDGNIIDDKSIFISPDKVVGYAKISKTKIVPVKIKEKGSISSDLQINSKSLDITEVKITGSKDLLDNTTEIYTDAIDLSKITEVNKVNNVKLTIPEGILIVKEEDGKQKAVDEVEVNVAYNISKLVTKNLPPLDVNINNLDPAYKAQLNPNKVSVILSGKQSYIDDLGDNDVTVNVDLSNLTEGTHQVPIKVNVLGDIKDHIKIESVGQEKIEVIITRN